MDKAVPLDSTQSPVPTGLPASVTPPSGVVAGPPPFVPVTHDQLLRAAIAATTTAATGAADIRRTFDAELSARAERRGRRHSS